MYTICVNRNQVIFKTYDYCNDEHEINISEWLNYSRIPIALRIGERVASSKRRHIEVAH